MARRRSAISATLGAVVAAFAAGVAVDRYLLPASAPEAALDRESAARGSPSTNLPSGSATLAADPARKPPRAPEAGGTVASTGEDAPKPEGARAGEAGTTVIGAVGTLQTALHHALSDDAAIMADRAAEFLDANASPDDREVGLLVAKWVAERGRKAEATRRVPARLGTRTPTSEEVAWLAKVDPRSGVAAARTLVARKPGSPDALKSLAEALEADGDTGGAFGAYEAALRAGLAADEGASELARLDPERAIPVLAALYAGRDVGAGVQALVEAYLRGGRVTDAGRELTRVATAGGGHLYALLRSASILVPDETVKALAGQMDDLDLAAKSDDSVLRAYGVALRRAGHRDNAIRVLRAVFERGRREDVLAEILLCDPVAMRAYVEAELPSTGVEASLDRIRVLGMLGRRDEAIAMFDAFTSRVRYRSPDAWGALAFATPDRAIAELRRGLEEARRSKSEDVTEWAVWLARSLAAAGRLAEAKAAWAEIPSRDLYLETLVERESVR